MSFVHFSHNVLQTACKKRERGNNNGKRPCTKFASKIFGDNFGGITKMFCHMSNRKKAKEVDNGAEVALSKNEISQLSVSVIVSLLAMKLMLPMKSWTMPSTVV